MRDSKPNTFHGPRISYPEILSLILRWLEYAKKCTASGIEHNCSYVRCSATHCLPDDGRQTQIDSAIAYRLHSCVYLLKASKEKVQLMCMFTFCRCHLRNIAESVGK